MRLKLEQLFLLKKKTIRQLNKLNIKYLAKIYEGFIKKKSVREIHKDIRKITEIQRMSGFPFTAKQERYCLELTKKIKKKIKADTDVPLFVYDFFEKNEIFQEINKISFEQGRKIEVDGKKKILNDEIFSNREEIKAIEEADEDFLNSKVFYLASAHMDSAKDHIDSQGRIYIDEEYSKLIKSEKVRQLVNIYVDNNNIRSFQWVVGSPVWFITRPNCRHYFRSVTIKEVLNNTVEQLLETYDMSRKIGGRQSQTIRHSTNKEWYTERNIENIIEKYKERYEYHNELYKVSGIDILKSAMTKDKFLIKKWENYLHSMR